MSGSRKKYLDDLVGVYWKYQQARFANQTELFEHPQASGVRPPIFASHESWRNIIVNPIATQKELDMLLGFVPEGLRHKWFRSMSSSQALALSIFGNLKLYDAIPVLSGLEDDEIKGLKLFGDLPLNSNHFVLEHKVTSLAEPNATRLDACITGSYQIAFEFKLSESEFGTCSRTGLLPTDAAYETDYCNGDYPSRPMRPARCPLIVKGARYWENIPYLFNWDKDGYYRPCPLKGNYQLVRVILAAGMSLRSVSSRNGHAVIFYDARNPAFHPNGKAETVYHEVKKALKDPHMLRKCSWQKLLSLLRENSILSWLTEEVTFKYGI